MIIGEKPPNNIIKSCDRKGVNLTKTITVYKPLTELEQVCRMPAKRSRSRSKSSRRSRSSKRSVTPPKIKKAKKARSRVIRQSRILRRFASNPKKIPSKWVPDWVAPSRRRSKKKIIIRRPKASTEAQLRRPVAKNPSFFKKTGSVLSAVKRKVSNTLRSVSSRFRRRPASTEAQLRRPSNKVRAQTRSQTKFARKPNGSQASSEEKLRATPIRKRLTSKRTPIRKVKSASVYSPYSSNLKKPYEDFSNKLRGVRSPHEIMVPQEPIEFRRMVFLQKIPEHLGENVAALKQRMADMEHIQRLLEAQLIKCRKSRTPERAVNNNQLVKIEKRIGELRTEEDQYNKYVQLMQEFISKYNQTKQEEQVKIDRLRYEIHDILKKVSSAFELQSQLFDTQEKILTNITNSAKASKTDLREWAKGIERVANEKDRLIEALVPATLKLQQVPEDTNSQLRESIRELQRIYDKQGTMFGQIPYQPYPQYGSENRVDHRSYQQSYPQSSELTQVLKNAERESLQKQFERLTDLILAKQQQQQAPAAIFQQQQQQQQAPQSPAVINNAGATKAELDELKAMISNLTRMVLEKPERKMEPAKWDLPETSSANVRKMQEMQRNRDELLPTGRDKGDYDNQRDILASILLEEQKSQQKPQENQKLAMIEKLLGSSGGKGGDSSALLDFIIKMKLLKGLGFDVSDIFGGTASISNNTNTITNGASGGSAEDKIMQKFEEVIRILNTRKCNDVRSPTALYPDSSRLDATQSVVRPSVDATQSVVPVANVSDRSVQLLEEILGAIRAGDVEGAHGHLHDFKNSIGTQTSNCDELASKLSDISTKLGSLLGGGGTIPQISQQVSSMNSGITRLTAEINSLVSNIQNIQSKQAIDLTGQDAGTHAGTQTNSVDDLTGQDAGTQTNSVDDLTRTQTAELNSLKKLLAGKVNELEKLKSMSNPLQQKLDEYARKLKRTKQLFENIPDCDGMELVAELRRFKEQFDQLEAGTAEPLPSWFDGIKVIVKKTLGMDLNSEGDRINFTDYLEVIGDFLTDNKIDDLQTLKDFIKQINKNKKCCEQTDGLIEIGKMLGVFENDMFEFDTSMNNLEKAIERLKEYQPKNKDETIAFYNSLKFDEKIKNFNDSKISVEHYEDLIDPDAENFDVDKKVKDQIREVRNRAKELIEKSEEYDRQIQLLEEEHSKTLESFEKSEKEAARQKREAADARKRLSMERKDREAAEEAARQKREADEEVERQRKADEDARASEENCEKYLDDIINNYTRMSDEVFKNFSKRYDDIKAYKDNTTKFNKLAKAIRTKITENEIYNNEIYNNDTFLRSVEELNKQDLTKLRCTNNNETIRKYKVLIDQIEDVNDDFENVQGIGKVIVKSRPKIPGENENFVQFATDTGNNKVNIKDCDMAETKERDINGEKGPYTAVFIKNDDKNKKDEEGKDYTNEEVFKKSLGLGSIKGTVETMAKSAYNTLFLSYGLSGSGKTHTLIGNSKDVAGVSQLSIDTISEKIKDKQNYKVYCSSIQIYNAQIYDCSPAVSNVQTYKVTNNPSEKGNGIEFLRVGKDVEDILVKWKNIENSIKLRDEIRKDLLNILSSEYAMKELKTASENFKTAEEEYDKLKLTSTVYDQVYNAKEKYKNAEKLLENVKKRSKEAVARGIVLKIGQPPFNEYDKNVDIITRFLEEAIKNSNKSDFNYVVDLLKLSNISNFNFTEKNPIYKPMEYKEGKIFDDAEKHEIKMDRDSFNKYVLNKVIPNRFTRATMSNPDSSRSHLFIRIKFENKEEPDKTFSMYIADLAGAERPYEYIGEASTEGYFVLLTLEQIKTIMNNYANHEGTERTQVNGLYDKVFATFVKSDVKNPSSTHTNKAVRDTKDALKEKFPDIEQDSGKAIYDTLSEILNWDNLQKPESKINKVITFILIKKYKPENDSVKSSNICDATNTTLTYGASLVSKIDIDKSNKFGRIARRRSYARKSAATLANEGTRAKRRSFKRPKRLPSAVAPAVGVVTNKARKRSYRRTNVDRAVATSPESVLSKLRRRSIRRVRRKRS